jgi:hypothetical protein
MVETYNWRYFQEKRILANQQTGNSYERRLCLLKWREGFGRKGIFSTYQLV